MKNLPIVLMLISTYLLLATPFLPTGAAAAWAETLTKGNKNITKFRFYIHNLHAGPNATAYSVANASITSTSPTTFGLVKVFDDRVTAEPDINSEQVARAQGTDAYSDLRTSAITLNVNYYITSGEFSGSTLSIVGRNSRVDPLREFPVVGGTGAFRLARGYVVARTYSSDRETDYSVYENTIYVITYSDEVASRGWASE